MREPAEFVSAAFPRPGRVLKAILTVLAITALTSAIVFHWAPGGDRGELLVRLLTFDPHHPERAWTFVTSALVMLKFSHALWPLLGLYFFATDLEKSWGGARLVRFLLTSVVVGNLAVLVAHHVAPPSALIFHFDIYFGPLAMLGAVTVAWAKEHAGRQIRFMFFLPMSGKTLYWVTIGMAALMVVFAEAMPEGVVAPFGGIAVGILLGGTPSLVRSWYLRMKLGSLKRKGGGLTVDEIVGGADRPRPVKRTKSGTPLRVVPGGLEEDLKNRKPPKDKRYLN